MAIIKYKGSFQKETEMFEEHDGVVMNKLRLIAADIGELNKNWRDDNSEKYLKTFNEKLVDLKELLDYGHSEAGRYFNQIQDVLDKFGTHSHAYLRDLPSLDISKILTSTGDGSIEINEEKVRSILEEMRALTRDVIAKCNEFHPRPVSLEGSSNDVIDAVQSNLDAASKAYLSINEPLNAINQTVEIVLEDYARRSSKIIDARARG